MVLSTNVLVISSKQELVVQKDDNLLRDASNDTNPGLAAMGIFRNWSPWS